MVIISSPSGGIFWDRPYGLGLADWDKALFTDAQDTEAFRNIEQINKSANSVLITHQHFREMDKVCKVAEKFQYKEAYQFVTYKPAQNAKGVNCHIYSTDNLLIHWKGGMNKATKYFAEPHPWKRHNFMILPMLRTKHGSSLDDLPINVTEKHPLISYTLSKQLFEPGKPVLVIGSGSGGEVVGLLRAGFDVVAMDLDKAQIEGLRQRLLVEKGQCDETAKQMEEYAQQARTDMLFYQFNIDEKKKEAEEEQADEVAAAQPKEYSLADREEVVRMQGCDDCGQVLNNKTPGFKCFKCDDVFHDPCMEPCFSGKHMVCSKCKLAGCCVAPPVVPSEKSE